MIMNIPWFEWVGYMASLAILISMLMKSILRLRIINTIGCVFFVIYGFVIHAYPVAIVNFIIALVNLYYIYKLKFRKPSLFSSIYLPESNDSIKNFISIHLDDIKKFNPNFTYNSGQPYQSWIILRDTQIAGILIGNKTDQNTFHIYLDYILPAYRDFKPGEFLFIKNPQEFTNKSYDTLTTNSGNEKHNAYLKKMGFNRVNNIFIKHLK